MPVIGAWIVAIVKRWLDWPRIVPLVFATLLAVGTAYAAQHEVPLVVAFRLSQDELDLAAKRVLNDNAALGPSTIGALRVRRVENVGGQVRFVVCENAAGDAMGFVSHPRQPAGTEDDFFEQLDMWWWYWWHLGPY